MLTSQQQRVLDYLDGKDWVVAREIMRGTGLNSESVYPVLATLCSEGYVLAEREPAAIPRVRYRLKAHHRSRKVKIGGETSEPSDLPKRLT